MRLGIFARTFPGTTPLAVMRAARQAGFDAVHYNFSCSGLPALPDRVDAATCAAIADAARQTGMTVATAAAPEPAKPQNATAPEAPQGGDPATESAGDAP